jgi:hypothetical protein
LNFVGHDFLLMVVCFILWSLSLIGLVVRRPIARETYDDHGGVSMPDRYMIKGLQARSVEEGQTITWSLNAERLWINGCSLFRVE